MIRINLLASLNLVPEEDPPKDDYTKIPRHAARPPSDHVRKNDLFGQMLESYLERLTREQRRSFESALPSLYEAGFKESPSSNWKNQFKLHHYQGIAKVGFQLVRRALQQANSRLERNGTEPISQGNLPFAKAFLWLYTLEYKKQHRFSIKEVIRWSRQLDGSCKANLSELVASTSELLGDTPKKPSPLDDITDLEKPFRMPNLESLAKELKRKAG